MSRLLAFTAASLVLVGLAGCATYRLERAVDKAVDTQNVTMAESKKQFDQQLKAEKKDEVAMPYVAGRSVPIARSVVVPEPLRRGVKTALLYRDGNRISLPVLAERILQVTGIPVRIKPDVFIPQARLVPTGGSTPGVPMSGASGRNDSDLGFTTDIELPREEIELSRLLDMVSTRLGIYWEYDNDQITFYRLTTLVKRLNMPPFQGKYSASLGTTTTSSQQGNVSSGGASFSNDSKLSLEATEFAPFKNILAAISAMRSPVGDVKAVAETGTIIYTDTKENVASAALLIDQQNRLLAMRASVRVRVVRAVTTDQGDTALDLNAIYDQMARMNPGVRFQSFSSAPVSNTTSGGFQFTIENPTDPAGRPTRWAGSDVFIQAVSTLSKSVSVTEIMETIPNHRTVASTTANKFSYVSEATPSSGGVVGGAPGSAGLRTSEQATGLVSSMTASITDENSMTLELSFSDSNLRALVREGNSQGAFVQNPNIDIVGVLRPITLRSGQTVMVKRETRDVDTSQRRRMGDSWIPLLAGGSDTAKSERQVIFVLVEGVIEG